VVEAKGGEGGKAEKVFLWSRWVGEDEGEESGSGSSNNGDSSSNNNSGSGSGSGSSSGTGTGSNSGGGSSGRKKKRGLHVLDCLDKFVEREQLNEAETLYCSACKQHLAPVKKMDLWSAPEVLIVHLKRFHYSPGQYFVHREKINEVGGWVVKWVGGQVLALMCGWWMGGGVTPYPFVCT
jgi:hypothetical protein